MKKDTFDITGMTCSACQAHIERAVGRLPGIDKAEVSLLMKTMNVVYDESAVSPEQIIGAVKRGGYGAALKGVQEKKSGAPQGRPALNEENAEMKRRLIISFVFFIPLFYISMGHMSGLPLPQFLLGDQNALIYAFTQLLLTLPIVYINRVFYFRGLKALFHGAPNMDSLIAVGSLAALIYGVFAIYAMSYAMGRGDMATVMRYHMDLYFESAGTILTLITLGKFLEERQKGKTGAAIAALIDLAPKTALIEREGREYEIAAEDVQAGDTVIVKAGMSVPVDGELIFGTGTLDASALTGESIPVEVGIGDKAASPSIAVSGYFKLRATGVGEDTALAKIIRLVEEASASRAPIAKLADKISAVFVPVVMSIALAAGIVWLLCGAEFAFALSIAISVLVISCPCALGLATPVAIMTGTGKGAAGGILIRSAEALETAHLIDTVVMDKTGTLTEGQPQVSEIVAMGGADTGRILSLAASLENNSEHPLAGAILKKAGEAGAALLPTERFEAVPGAGIGADIGGRRYYAGNARYMQKLGVYTQDTAQAEERLANEGKTVLYLADDERLLGIIAVIDRLKPTSAAAVAELKNIGIDVVMLSGDNERTARAIAKSAGIDNVIAGVLPDGKEAVIRELKDKGKRVAMLGDGINDAPALARADVGIAIGAGTDIAIEAADIILVKSDPLDAVSAIELSRAVIRNIKENLFWAFFYNTICIPIAAGALYPALGIKLDPMFAAAAMSLSSVCVVTNALRLRFFRPSFKKKTKKSEVKSMKTSVIIEGMSCNHCRMAAEKALAGLAGASEAKVDLEKKTGTIISDTEIADDDIRAAIAEAGFSVSGITRA